MTDTFLSRFVGRTQTISKLGPEELLRGKQQSVIYTNTRQSFDRLNFPLPNKPSGIIYKSTHTESSETEKNDNFHLPHLNQKYLNRQSQRKHKTLYRNQNAQVYYHKETNWVIEQSDLHNKQKKFQDEANKPPLQPKNAISKEDLTNSHLKETRKQYSLNIKASKPKNNKLGGLGPNIGGQQWLIRREKAQKANRYAKQLKKLNRQRYLKSLDQAEFICFSPSQSNLYPAKNMYL